MGLTEGGIAGQLCPDAGIDDAAACTTEAQACAKVCHAGYGGHTECRVSAADGGFTVQCAYYGAPTC